jgi:electron transfer flavoprotein alpha subunit
MGRTLIIAEHDGSQLNTSTAKSVRCAADLGQPIDIAIFAADTGSLGGQAAEISGVERVLTIQAPHNEHPVAAILAPQVVAMSNEYSHLLGPSTTFGRDLMPRVAGLLGVAQVSDIMAVDGAHAFHRPVYAGGAIVAVEAPADMILVGTVRTASYQAADGGGSAAIESRSLSVELPSHTRYLGLESDAGDRPDLQAAARVIGAGRALGGSDEFELIYRLADRLGAAVGASRAAVDAGYCPNDLQIGQTGKIIAPDLYIAIGISGAIQHLTGIKDAGTIVAINKDPDAPIFEVSDIGLVGDLFDVIPEFEAALD